MKVTGQLQRTNEQTLDSRAFGGFLHFLAVTLGKFLHVLVPHFLICEMGLQQHLPPTGCSEG